MIYRVLTVILTGLLAVNSLAQNSEAPVSAAQALDQIIQSVQQKTLDEKRHQDQRVQRFQEDKDKQEQLLKDAQAAFNAVNSRADQLRASYEANEKSIDEKTAQMKEAAGDLNELFAVVRQVAVGTASTVENSMVSAEFPGRAQYLHQMGKSTTTPRIDDLRQLWSILLTEMNQSGKVSRFDASIIRPDGEETAGEIIRVGTFTAVSDGQFLKYIPSSSKMVQLAKQPAPRHRQLAENLQTSDDTYVDMSVDPSKGAILGLLVLTPDMQEKIGQGGLIGYLILVIGATGLLIIAYRFFVIFAQKRSVEKQLESGELKDKSPLARLLQVVDDAPNPSAEVLSMRLDEQMAEESSALHRGLATVAVLAAVSPLLGLLGTVTGMIETFNSITLFGTGDPKLMSGGISQALITTQLGLAVAIPLVLLHSLLVGRANDVVELMGRYSADLFSNRVHN